MENNTETLDTSAVKKENYPFKGTHVLAELYQVQQLAFEREPLNTIIQNACQSGNATIIDLKTEVFPTGGYTLVALLKESHLSVHTYPEHQAVFLDVFTCGQTNPQKIAEKIIAYYQPASFELQTITRGHSSLPSES